jgi:hypothetical protein
MPMVVLEVPDVYESSSRPIAVQIAKKIMEDLNPPKNARVVYPGDIGKVAQAKSTIDDTRESTSNFLGTDATIVITLDEVPIEHRVLSTAVTRLEENLCVFLDRDLGISLKPIYTPTEATVSFRMRFKDRASAERWRNEVKTRYSQGRVEVLHEIVHHYAIPVEMIYMILKMHEIRENPDEAPLNETLDVWFERCWDKRITTVTNHAGNLGQSVMVIPENQIGILGWFDFSYIPDKQERDDIGTYVVGFDYKYQYDKITDIVMKYPVMIHNQVLPSSIRDDNIPYSLDQRAKAMQYSKSLFEFMQSRDPKFMSSIEGYPVPQFDDWLPGWVNRGVSTLLTVLVEVSHTDGRDLFELDEIPEYEFHEDILPFLVIEAPFIDEIGKSIFYFNMFEGTTSTGMHKVTMDADLNLRTVDLMNIQKVNHFHFGFITDWSMLDEAALERLRKNPKALLVCLDTIGMADKMPAIMSNGWVSREDMMKLVNLTAHRPYDWGLRTAYGYSDDNPGNTDLEARRKLRIGHYRIQAINETSFKG